ncbi:MAG: hypothetical protein PHG63_02285 [Candidatus Dojkabacteria bacterium]|nr:hypothetical protein [Candidatus Dojkabacteria bacterium]
MKAFLLIIISAVFVAVLNAASTAILPVDFVWVFAVALFLSGEEGKAVLFALVSGTIFDIMVRGHAGIASLSMMVGLIVLVAGRSMGITERAWQKAIVVFVSLFFAEVTEAAIRAILDGLVLSVTHIELWASSTAYNAVAVALLLVAMRYMQGARPARPAVRL